ncbi:MAG: hypothetical protein ACI82A_001264 [Candidatus Azotimanducaceae bacterium]|jgi:hypothetical protein
MTKKKGSNTDTKATTTEREGRRVESRGNAIDQQDYESRRAELINEFLSHDDPERSDAVRAECILLLILQLRRLQHGAVDYERPWPKLDEETIDMCAVWDTDDPDLALIQKVLNRLADGRGERGVTLLKDAIIAAAEKFSAEQRERATGRRTGPKHVVAVLIIELVTDNQEIDVNTLRHKINAHPIVDKIKDDFVYLKDESISRFAISGLKNRLNRIKKDIKSQKPASEI